MHAYLITGGSPESKNQKIKDLISEQKAKIFNFTLQKIEDCRDLKKIIKYSFSEKTAIVIENIDTATTETANAFLKNLEEPNNNLLYILTAEIKENVLPTIISRCQIIKVQNIKQTVQSGYGKFLDLGLDQKFEYVGKIKDRGEAIEFVKTIIEVEHLNNNFKNQQNYLNTLKNLKRNGNVSLQLTNLLVTSFS